MACEHKSIANMDHVRGYLPDLVPMVNRCCIKCFQHWAGPVGAVVEYTKAEWDARIANAFSVENI